MCGIFGTDGTARKCGPVPVPSYFSPRPVLNTLLPSTGVAQEPAAPATSTLLPSTLVAQGPAIAVSATVGPTISSPLTGEPAISLPSTSTSAGSVSLALGAGVGCVSLLVFGVLL